MKHLGLLVLTYLCCVLQTNFRHACAVGPVEPHFTMLAVMIVVLTVDGAPAVMWVAFVGLLSDALTPGRLGVDMLCSVLAVMTVLRWTSRPYLASVLGQAIFGTVTVCLALLPATALRCLLAGESIEAGPLVLTPLATGAYTAIMGVGLVVTLRLMKQLRPMGPVHGSLRISNHWNRLTTDP